MQPASMQAPCSASLPAAPAAGGRVRAYPEFFLWGRSLRSRRSTNKEKCVRVAVTASCDGVSGLVRDESCSRHTRGRNGSCQRAGRGPDVVTEHFLPDLPSHLSALHCTGVTMVSLVPRTHTASAAAIVFPSLSRTNHSDSLSARTLYSCVDTVVAWRVAGPRWGSEVRPRHGGHLLCRSRRLSCGPLPADAFAT